jgi:hypothetical protein
MRRFQKKEVLIIGLVQLIFPEGPITENVDAEKVEGFSDRLIDLGDILNDGCGCFDSGNFLYLEVDLFRKAPSKGGDLEIGFSGDMIHGGVEGFNGRVDGRLDTDEDGHSQGDSYHGKKGSSFMVPKMAEGDVFEEVKEDHK